MRQKHSSKKHRIVSLAAEKIANEIVSDKFLEDGFQKQNDPEADQTLRAKQYEYFNPQDVQITQKEEKKSFKQCKIRHLIDSRNLSPTHSDIDYIDTMENYKTYLNKNQSLQAAAKTIKTLKPKRSQHQIVKENIKSKKTDANSKLLKQKLQKEFTMIQEKIEKAKQFGLRSSSDKHFQDIYDEINKARLAQKGIKQNENFCLMSVNQYLKLTSALQSAMLNINGSGLCKTICHKAIRRPLSLEAKRWYHSKPYKTQRQIDPEGLVKAITLEKWNEKKLAFHKAHNSRQKTLKNKSFELNASQFTQKQKQTQETIQIRNKRPATAPNGKLKQKCRTEECPLTSSSHFNIKNRTKISPSNFDIKNIIPLRRKVKGVKHVERQKWDYKLFRKQSQELFKSSKTQVVSDQIFQYPWNWIKFQNTSKIHARQWKT